MMGLRYAALDFIVDAEGEAWFLTSDPGGEFLSAEIQAGLPISDAVAGALGGACRQKQALSSCDVAG